MLIGLGEGEGGKRRGIVVIEGEAGDGFGRGEVVEHEIVLLVSNCEVVLESLGKLPAKNSFAHGLVVIFINAELRSRWFRFFIDSDLVIINRMVSLIFKEMNR